MIIAIIILFFVSLFFSGSETALTAINKMRLQTKAGNNDKRAEKLLKLVSKPGEFITTISIGYNIANILLPTLVTTLAIQHGFNVGIASAILTVITIVFSESIPKSVAAAFPSRIAAIAYPVIRFFVIVFKPITIVLNWLTGFITGALAKGHRDKVSISKEELGTMVDIADSEGTFEQNESLRIKELLDFYSLKVIDVSKTPRVEITALPSTATFEEVRDVVNQTPFTRYPVYKGDMDNIVAVFHSKYLLSWSEDKKKSLEAISSTDPLIVFKFHSIEWVFRKLTKEKKHMAIVSDEYGGTEGILTYEDIIETMIGVDIEDEVDPKSEAIIEKVTETEIICDGKIMIHRLNSIFGTEIPEEEKVLAGYLLKNFNCFPEDGDIVERNNLTFKVLEMEGKMMSRILITK